MGAQGEALAAKLGSESSRLAQVIEQLSDEQWRTLTAPEGWSVGVTAHHTATSYESIAGAVQRLAGGQGFPSMGMDQVDAGNAEHARQFANCSKQETLEALRKGNAAATAVLRGLSDEQLATTTVAGPLGGQTLSAAQFAEMALIGHPQVHLSSIQAAL